MSKRDRVLESQTYPACDYCGAGEGSPCRYANYLTGPTTNPHAARRRLIEEQGNRYVLPE